MPEICQFGRNNLHRIKPTLASGGREENGSVTAILLIYYILSTIEKFRLQFVLSGNDLISNIRHCNNQVMEVVLKESIS